MQKCNECGLEKDQHTQLPHRFVSIPPNPDQGVLFDVGFALSRFDALDSLMYATSTGGRTLKGLLKDLQKGEEVTEYHKTLLNADWALTQPNQGYPVDWPGVVAGWGQIAASDHQEGFKFADRSDVEFNPKLYLNWPRGVGKNAFLKDWHDARIVPTPVKRTPPSLGKLRMNVIDYSMGEYVPKEERMQAKDIPEDRLIKLVQDLNDMDKRTHLAALCDAWPHVPYKVLQAKLRRLERRGIIEGCYCGCSTQNRVLTNAEKESRFQLKREEWLRQIQSTDE